MKIIYISIFPDIFESFVSTTLVSRAVTNWLLSFEYINPRHFCDDKHRTIDDSIYGGGQGMLMKAPPLIASIRHIVRKYKLTKSAWWKNSNRHIIMPWPSTDTFTQQSAHNFCQKDLLIFICGRYEGIDHRVSLWLDKTYPKHRSKLSLGQFITLGGELPAMTMTEAIVRLIPGVIKEESSRQDESYAPEHHMTNIEYPQYTRPEIVERMTIPDVLLSGHHAQIEKRKKNNTQYIGSLSL